MPRLVVLNFFSSARGGTCDMFSSTSTALVDSGINAVAVMQFTVSDQAAVWFALDFYTALARGRRIDEMAWLGRSAIAGIGEQTLEWVTPVLYLRTDEVRLFTLTASRAGPEPTEPPTGEQVIQGGHPRRAVRAGTGRAAHQPVRSGDHSAERSVHPEPDLSGRRRPP